MADESLRRTLRQKIAMCDHRIAAQRRFMRDGQLEDWQMRSQVGLLCTLLDAHARAVAQLQEHFPTDELLTRPMMSQPLERELMYRYDHTLSVLRHYRNYLTDGLDDAIKLWHLWSVRNYLCKAAELERFHRTFYPDSPNQSWFQLRSEPTPFELEHPEEVSGDTQPQPPTSEEER